MKTLDIAWLAGLWEGEGCFLFNKTPTMAIEMTDLDVIERVSSLMKHKVLVHKRVKMTSNKPMYCVKLYGKQAAAWMMTFLPLLGKRRLGKVKECLLKWRASNIAPTDRTHCLQGHEYTIENTAFKASRPTHRVCLICRTAYQQSRKYKQHVYFKTASHAQENF
jgi:hypothetical protein